MKKIFVIIFLLVIDFSFAQEYSIKDVIVYDWEIAKTANPDTIYGISFKRNKLNYLPVELKKFTHLIVLDLSKNKLEKLPPFFSIFKNLVDLNIEKNKLKYFPIIVYQLTELKYLRLGVNPFERVPNGIDNLTNLQYLDLYDCPIKSLPESITQLKNIQKIDFTGIRFSPNFQESWIKKMPNVELIFDAPCDCLGG